MSNVEAPRPAVPAGVPVLRWLLLAVLAFAVVGSLLELPVALQAGAALWRRVTPVALLALFVAGYAGYRYVLVRQGRYSGGKALARVGLMVLGLAVIASLFLDRPVAPPSGPSVDLAAPLASADPAVRALAAEVARVRPAGEGRRHLAALAALAEDDSPEVRRQARASLGALTGADAGEGAGASSRWLELCRQRGLLPPGT